MVFKQCQMCLEKGEKKHQFVIAKAQQMDDTVYHGSHTMTCIKHGYQLAFEGTAA